MSFERTYSGFGDGCGTPCALQHPTSRTDSKGSRNNNRRNDRFSGANDRCSQRGTGIPPTNRFPLNGDPPQPPQHHHHRMQEPASALHRRTYHPGSGFEPPSTAWSRGGSGRRGGRGSQRLSTRYGSGVNGAGSESASSDRMQLSMTVAGRRDLGGRGYGGGGELSMQEARPNHRSHLQHPRRHRRHELPQQQQLHTTGRRPWTIYDPTLPPSGISQTVPEEETRTTNEATALDISSEEVAVSEKKSASKACSITVVSYNVLADSLVSLEYIPYCRGWNKAAWDARPGRILQKILDFKPNVVCLQEVDEDQYKNVFNKRLGSKGYRGVYCKRSGDKQDGCATFVLEKGKAMGKSNSGYSRLRISVEEHVQYKIHGHPLLDRDNVALLVVVDVLPSPEKKTGQSPGGNFGTPSERRSDAERKSSSSPVDECPDGKTTMAVTSHNPRPTSDATVDENICKTGGDDGESCSVVATPAEATRLVVANTHLLFNPKRGEIKTAQLMVLTKHVEMLAQKSGASGVIVCGDFNMTPDSALYHYMIKGTLDVNGLNRFDVSGQCEVVKNHRHDQRREVANCGTLQYRGPKAKHQGSGCTLGSFRRFSATGAAGGGRGGQRRGRGQGGRGSMGGLPPPHQMACTACSARIPHEATASYTTPAAATSQSSTRSGDSGRSPAFPPGVAPGGRFAIMNPAPCACTKQNIADSSRISGLATGNASGMEQVETEKGVGKCGGCVYGEEDERYCPPCLWQNGRNESDSRGAGPLCHGLRLRSAYAQQGDAWGTGEPAFTSYHHLFKGTVDYVFYGPGPAPSRTEAENVSEYTVEKASDPLGRNNGNGDERLRCVGVAEPPLRCELDKFGGIPSPEEPSDHILLAVRFEISTYC